MRADDVDRSFPFSRWGCCLAAAAVLAAGAAEAQTLQAKARESGCVDAPRVVEGAMYKCTTASGASAYFNVPEPGDRAPANRGGSGARGGTSAATAPTPTTFPRVDANTQKGRDEMRRKVLQDELAAEEKLLREARSTYNSGAPAALPDEKEQPQRYAERITRLRQAVQLHERNVEALRRELGLPR